nr:uncharacterized protein LOC131779867 [Pocillopora verrucosa]
MFELQISSVYTKNPGKQLYTVGLVDLRYSSGSVVAKVELKFERSVLDPLKPLEDEIKDGKLGSFTVSRELDLNPTSVPFTNFSATAASFTNVTSTGYLVTNITVTANPFTNITVTAVPSTTSRASAVPSTTSRASGADQSGDRKKQTMLHVIYSTTIFLLLVIIIVLVFVIWRGKNRQGSLKQKSQQHNHRKNHIDLQANVNMKKHDNSL